MVPGLDTAEHSSPQALRPSLSSPVCLLLELSSHSRLPTLVPSTQPSSLVAHWSFTIRLQLLQAAPKLSPKLMGP